MGWTIIGAVIVVFGVLAVAFVVVSLRKRAGAGAPQAATAPPSVAPPARPAADPAASADPPPPVAPPRPAPVERPAAPVIKARNAPDQDAEELGDVTLMADVPEDLIAESRRHGKVEALVDLGSNALEDEPTALHSVILVTATGTTDVGKRRKNNEDRLLVLDDAGVFAVADGMGGHAAGEVASELAIETLAEAFRTGQYPGRRDPKLPRRGDELVRSVMRANRAIWKRATADPSLAGMGTTIVAARFSPAKNRVYIVHVGDSRCYRLRDGEMKQLTGDHTLGALTGVRGRIGDQLTRALGIAEDVAVDLGIDAPLPGDHYMLCSDGLSKMVPDDEIRTILAAEPDLTKGVQRLIDEANEHGGSDNVSVILVRVDDARTAPALV